MTISLTDPFQAEKDAQLQEQKEQKWQEWAAKETERRQKAESSVKEIQDQQSQERRQEAEPSTKGLNEQERQKAEQIERVRAKWKSLSLGMSPQQVQGILGQPDGVSDYGSGATWNYTHFGVGYVTFSAGIVNGWSSPIGYY